MPTILHLTDLHFGCVGDPARRNDRAIVLEGLLKKAKQIERKPEVLCITGDLGWKGPLSDYTACKDWLLRLISALELSVEDLILCPGNHDRHRARITRPGTTAEADYALEHLLENGEDSYLAKPFSAAR